MYWWVTHRPAGDAPVSQIRRAGTQSRGGEAQARSLPRRPRVDASLTREEDFMDLNRDAMLVGLHIAAWSGRLYDREASDHVAVAHEASTGAGRYNKRLLPKAAFAAAAPAHSDGVRSGDAEPEPASRNGGDEPDGDTAHPDNGHADAAPATDAAGSAGPIPPVPANGRDDNPDLLEIPEFLRRVQ